MGEQVLLDNERKHLESLLKDRINFYLVFASLFIAGTVSANDIDPTVRTWILYVGAAVSLLLCAAVIRTTWLVERALNRLDTSHPLVTLRAGSNCILLNANYHLVLIPVIMSALFIWMAIYDPAICQPN